MNSTFSTRLKEERLKKKLTQQQLSDLINSEITENKWDVKEVPRTSITRYENGTRVPNYITLCVISIVLGVDTDYLLGKSDKRHISNISESLNNLTKLFETISSNDDPEMNKTIQRIINSVYDILAKSYTFNFLDNVDVILKCVLLSLDPISIEELSDIIKNIKEQVHISRKKASDHIDEIMKK